MAWPDAENLHRCRQNHHDYQTVSYVDWTLLEVCIHCGVYLMTCGKQPPNGHPAIVNIRADRDVELHHV